MHDKNLFVWHKTGKGILCQGRSEGFREFRKISQYLKAEYAIL